MLGVKGRLQVNEGLEKTRMNRLGAHWLTFGIGLDRVDQCRLAALPLVRPIETKPVKNPPSSVSERGRKKELAEQVQALPDELKENSNIGPSAVGTSLAKLADRDPISPCADPSRSPRQH